MNVQRSQQFVFLQNIGSRVTTWDFLVWSGHWSKFWTPSISCVCRSQVNHHTCADVTDYYCFTWIFIRKFYIT